MVATDETLTGNLHSATDLHKQSREEAQTVHESHMKDKWQILCSLSLLEAATMNVTVEVRCCVVTTKGNLVSLEHSINFNRVQDVLIRRSSSVVTLPVSY